MTRSIAIRPARAVALPSKVAFLRLPASYPEPTYRVEAIETHMSWVFLTDGHAYKLKKPVRHDCLDFRSAAARRHFCDEELRLNRRLAPSVYLAVVPLTIDAHGHLRLDGDGAAVDWLVKMRRLPLRQMLDYLLAANRVSVSDMRRIAARLLDFYRSCAPLRLAKSAYCGSLLSHIGRNQRLLATPLYRLDHALIDAVCDAQRRFVEAHSDMLEQRAAAGKIVEGHGDLRPEHVCLEDGVTIIDCLEFARELRLADPIDEVGFLALECERLGAASMGGALLRSYCDLSGDCPGRALIDFYQGMRAATRALLAARHLDEPKFRCSDTWRMRATGYLQLAKTHQDSINSSSEPPS